LSDEIHGTVRIRKWGGSLVIVLPPDLREFFGAVHRDMLSYRKVGRMICLKRISAAELLPVTQEEAVSR